MDKLNDKKEKKKPKTGKRTKRQKAPGFFYYMKPDNLASEVRRYGYTYTPGKTIGVYAVLAAAVVAVGMLYRLRWQYGLAVLAAGIVILPAVIFGSYKKMYEQQRFSDLVLYMEQMLYSFRRKQKVLSALYDTLEVFENEENRMHQNIVRAINVIETRADSLEGLQEIEKGYENDRLVQMHRMLLKIERLGGDCSSSIALLLESNKQWADRTGVQQKLVAKQRRDLVIVIGLNMFICGILLYVMPEGYDYTGMGAYQWVMTAFFAALLFIYAKIDKKMCISWIGEEETRPPEQTLKSYEAVRQYDAAAEKKKSRCYAVVPGTIIAGILAYSAILGKMPGLAVQLVLFTAIGFFFICIRQHEIGYRLNVKIVTKELEKKFPTWLMEVALRSQVSNIQMAIMGSYDSCAPILQPALKELIADMQADPVSIMPYVNFLKEFDVPEVHSAMKMFYAISQGKGGGVDEQVTELIARNNQLLDKAEQIRNEEQAASFRSLQYAVMAVGIVALLADTALMTVSFFQTPLL